MKKGIHPKYEEVTARCACGKTFKTKSTKSEIRVDICSNCHPFFTGTQKLIDTAGMVDKFDKKYQKTEGKTIRRVTKQEVRKLARKSGKAIKEVKLKSKGDEKAKSAKTKEKGTKESK